MTLLTRQHQRITNTNHHQQRNTLTMNNLSNAHAVDNCSQRLNALHTHVPAKASVKINGTSMSLAAVIKVYQSSLDNRAAVSTKRNELKMALKERAKSEASRRATDRALKAWVITQFGADSKAALDFGFPPSKVTPKTAETKALAVEKGRATRKARHTMGKKERLLVIGTVTSTAPAAPAITVVQPASPPAASITPPLAPIANGVTNGAASHS